MRNFISLCLVFAGVFYWYHHQAPVVPSPLPFTENVPVVEIKPEQDTHIKDIINAVNDKNVSMNSLYAEADVYVDGMEVYSELYYQKDNKFRMLFYGLVNVNLDIGSNDDTFWFWSKQYDRNTVYWAKHEDYSKTRLKTPFNPIWIMESLGAGEVSGDTFKEDDKYLKVYKNVTINGNRKVTRAVMIDKTTLNVVGTYIYSLNGDLLISSEWTSNRELNIKWTEENQNMIIKFTKWHLNASVDNFKMPSKRKQVDMGKMK
jgi:hypothetical protein